MNMVAHPVQEPAESEIRAALERAVASPVLAASPRLASFLRYVVERTLAGDAVRLKGYTIAVEALDRPQSFDPQIDPIVRVEAGRLRRALARFYSGAGRDEPVVIELPLGCYVPMFRRRGVPLDAGDPLLQPGLAPVSDPSRTNDSAALEAVFDLLIERRRLQVREMLAEIQTMKVMLRRSRERPPSR
jgi:hypothetical protein